MIKAVLVDDERKCILTLQNLLEKHCTDFIVTGNADNIKDALKVIEQRNPDVLFLDIEMADGTGFNLLQKLDDPFLHFVFVTAHSRYAIKAFKYSAIDYLLKPIDIDDLKNAAEKIRNRIRNDFFLEQLRQGHGKMLDLHGKMLDLKINKEIIYISSDQLVHLEASGSYSSVYTLDKKRHIVSASLSELQRKLDLKNFIRVHRSAIININHIRRIVKTDGFYAEMVDGSRVEISRRNKAHLFAAFQDQLK